MYFITSGLLTTCLIINLAFIYGTSAEQTVPFVVSITRSIGCITCPGMAYVSTEEYCTGSLISIEYVLTSASCIRSPVLRDGHYWFHYGVDVGVGNKQQEKIFVPKEDCIQHPCYINDGMSTAYDIGLLRIRGRLTKSTNINTIQLTPRNNVHNMHLGKHVRLLGFEGLWYTDMVITQNDVCRAKWSNPESCRKGHGGPIIYEEEKALFQIGIALITFRENRDKYCDPSHRFTRVSSHLNWIEYVKTEAITRNRSTNLQCCKFEIDDNITRKPPTGEENKSKERGQNPSGDDDSTNFTSALSDTEYKTNSSPNSRHAIVPFILLLKCYVKLY